jgi:hypothetical protein
MASALRRCVQCLPCCGDDDSDGDGYGGAGYRLQHGAAGSTAGDEHRRDAWQRRWNALVGQVASTTLALRGAIGGADEPHPRDEVFALLLNMYAHKVSACLELLCPAVRRMLMNLPFR